MSAQNASSARRGRTLLKWLLGLAIATAGAWVWSAPFVRSVVVYVPDEVLGTHVAKSGQVYRFRDEGWADTRFGRHGLVGIDDVAVVPGPKVAIWGDSFVVGYQVADEEKVASRVTELSAAGGGR